MKRIISMDVFNLILGVLITIVGVVWLIYERKRYRNVGENDHMRKSFFVNIYLGIFILIAIGLVLIYRSVF